MDNGEWRIHVEIPADFVTIQLLRDDSLSQSLDGSLDGAPKASLFEGGGPRSGSEGVND